MIRSGAVLLFCAISTPSSFAQLVPLPSPRPVPTRPGGVINPPVLPSVSGVTPRTVQPSKTYWVPGGLGWGGGYFPFWPMWYDLPPRDDRPFVVPMPAPTPVTTTPLTPKSAPDTRARLKLDVPAGSRVWLDGRPVDANALPVVLESPSLREGQNYSFVVRVEWKEDGKTEERSRVVVVPVGEQKSLSYFASR